MSAMERAGNEDMSDDVERKGLGTPATRADIIEKLVKDGFVKREKKQMLPTEDGMKLITVLPDVVKSSKLTADWENALSHEVEILPLLQRERWSVRTLWQILKQWYLT